MLRYSCQLLVEILDIYNISSSSFVSTQTFKQEILTYMAPGTNTSYHLHLILCGH